MEHNPIQTMLFEHEVISKSEYIINDLDHYWVSNSKKYTEIVNLLVTFFREYADGNHHRKEEDVLFPAICNHPDFKLQEIIDELEQHHEDFRYYTKEIKEALDKKDYERSYDELKKYVQDLLDHIAVENDELFIIIETLLNEEELETIYFKFKDIDMELGNDEKYKLEQILDTIEIIN